MRRNKLERFPDMFLHASLIFCKARAYPSKATYWTTPKASQQGLSTKIRPSWKKHAKQSSLFWLQEMKKYVPMCWNIFLKHLLARQNKLDSLFLIGLG